MHVISVRWDYALVRASPERVPPYGVATLPRPQQTKLMFRPVVVDIMKSMSALWEDPKFMSARSGAYVLEDFTEADRPVCHLL